MKRILAIIFLVCFSVLVVEGWYLVRDGLNLRRLIGWEENSLQLGWDTQAKQALTQRYYSFARGRQTFAFVSEDGRYVIKIPRHDRYQIPLWVRSIPLAEARRKRAFLKAQNRKRDLFNSFRIAFDSFREQTALVAVCFPGREGRGEYLKIADRLGRFYDLPLEKTGFILQYRKEIMKDVLKKENEVGRVLEQLVFFVRDRAKQGIMCPDPKFLTNFGFDEKGAYQIDIGDFFQPKGLDQEMLLNRNIGTLRSWVEKFDPSLLPVLDQKIESICK